MSGRRFKIIACRIALREICHVVARSQSVIDVEFLPQGLHNTPRAGGVELQRRIDATPSEQYDAILVGYGLCGNLIRGLKARDIPLVTPRAHDCIAMFLGSKERHRRLLEGRPGCYYYTAGWLECLERRDGSGDGDAAQFLPGRTAVGADHEALLAAWTQKYGEEEALYLLRMMDDWTRHYTHGVWIDFDFLRPLRMDRRVAEICAVRGWGYEEAAGDLGLFQRWVDGEWNEEEFLVVPPGGEITPSYDDRIIAVETPEARAAAALRTSATAPGALSP
jgi:Protein of unknown function (DUF1638)